MPRGSQSVTARCDVDYTVQSWFVVIITCSKCWNEWIKFFINYRDASLTTVR